MLYFLGCDIVSGCLTDECRLSMDDELYDGRCLFSVDLSRKESNGASRLVRESLRRLTKGVQYNVVGERSTQLFFETSHKNTT